MNRGMVLDCIVKKIFINDKKLTSKDICSQSETITILVILMKHVGNKVRNYQLPCSSYTKNKNQMVSKILNPLKNVLWSYLKYRLKIQCFGTSGCFYLILQQQNLPVRIIGLDAHAHQIKPRTLQVEHTRIHKKKLLCFLETIHAQKKFFSPYVCSQRPIDIDFFEQYHACKKQYVSFGDVSIIDLFQSAGMYKTYRDFFHKVEMLYQKQIWKLYLNSEDTPLSLSFYNHAQYIYSCLQTGVINRVVKIGQTQHDRGAKEFFEQQGVSYVYASRVVTTHIPSVCPSTLRFGQRDCILFDSIHASKEDASLFQDMYTASDSGTNFVVYGAMYGLCDMFYTPDTYVQGFVLEQTPLAVPCITERLDADMLLFAKK